MAQLKDTVISGSLRVTDTIFGNLILPKKIEIEHATDGYGEVRVKYGSTIDMAFMIGDANVNHGIYDWKKSGGAGWVLMADSNNKWNLYGNADSASTAAQGVAETSWTNWRSIALGTNNSTTRGFTPNANGAGVLYNCVNLSFQPSTGTLQVGTQSAGNIWSGYSVASTEGTGERDCGVWNGSGKLYLYAEAATNGYKGIYGYKTNLTSGFHVLRVNSDGNMDQFATMVCSLVTGNLTIGGTPATDAGKKISSSSTLYLNCASGTSIILSRGGTNYVRLDTDNNFRPETDNERHLGTASYRWAYVNSVRTSSLYYYSNASLTARPTTINFDNNPQNSTGRISMRLDICGVTNNVAPTGAPPHHRTDLASSGYLQTFFWDTSTHLASQLYIPVGSHLSTSKGPASLKVRGYDNGWKPWRPIQMGDDEYIYSDTINVLSETRRVKKVSGSAEWNAQLYSKNGYKNCKVSFQTVNTSAAFMVGLNSDPTTDANWTSIDYCWQFTSDGKLYIRESNGNTISPGTGHTTYAANDEFSIEYSNGYVRYYHNGILCRQVARTLGSILYLDSSFHTVGGAIYNLKFEPMQSNTAYGTTLPTSAVEGQTFFQVSDPWYELPPGGTSGQVLTKASNSDRDVSWASPSQAGVNEIANMIYPVGSIYMSVNSTNPSTLFGGTWERLKDRFLLSAGDSYSAGGTGGEATHTLVEGELPSHTHTLSSHTHTLSSHTHNLGNHTHTGPSHDHSPSGAGSFVTHTTSAMGGYAGTVANNFGIAATSNKTGLGGTGQTGGPSSNTSGGPSTNTSGGPSTNTSGSTGSGTAHNNMPPYLVVYMWKRTA